MRVTILLLTFRCIFVLVCCTRGNAVLGVHGYGVTLIGTHDVISAGRITASPEWVPTRLGFMPARYLMMQQAVSGYERTGISLVAIDGDKFVPAGKADDIGLYYLVPKIKRRLGISTAQTIDLVLFSIIVCSTVSGIAGVCRLIMHHFYRLAGMVALCCVAVISAFFGDVYVVQSGIVVAAIPWILYFSKRDVITAPFYIFAFLLGLAIAVASMLRFNAGTPVLVFALIVFLFQIRTTLHSRVLLIGALAIGCFLPRLYFETLLRHRDGFLSKVDQNYTSVVAHHPLWHNIYAGLGFLNNDYGLKVRDEAVMEKVRTIDPSAQYPSPAYERVARQEVFKAFRAHPKFALFSIATKTGVLLSILVICAGPGLIAAVRNPKPWPIECAFWSAMFVASLNGVLVVPWPTYLLGFAALAVLYGIFSLEANSKTQLTTP